MNYKSLKIRLIAVAVAGAVYQTPALAQSGSRALLEEVQVFGTKRSNSEAAQDVPAQVSAYDSSQLDALQVVTIEDLSFSMPNVSLDQIGTFPGVANFSIRGFGINSSTSSVDPAVGLFIDGIYNGVNWGSVVDAFDLESIEVFRGPQGVLFGRNVTGGAVLMRTARPTPGDGFKSKIKVGYEERDQLTLSGSVEASLTDSLAAKVSVYSRDDGGYFKNEFLDEYTGARETQLLKFTAVWFPAENLDVTLIYEDGSMDGDGTVAQFPNTTLRTPNDRVQVRQGTVGETDQNWERYVVELNWAIGPGRLTNIFGYKQLDVFAMTDADGAEANSFIVDTRIGHEQVSNELRYNFDATDSWNVTLGAYYFEADLASVDGRFLRTFNSEDVQGNLLRGVAGGFQTHIVRGLFWNNEIALTDTVGVTLGARYTEEEKNDVSVNGFRFDGLGPCDPVALVCQDNQEGQDQDWSNVTPKLGVQWSLSDDAQLYASYTNGFRSGGFDQRASAEYAGVSYDEEDQTSYEIGVKSVFNGGTMRFNAALFYNEVENLQRTSFFTDALGLPQQLTKNVADATISGAEMDLTVLLSEAFLLTINAGFLDASYDDVFASFDPVFSVEDQADFELARAPEFTFGTSLNYDFALAEHGLLSSRISYSYRASTFYDDRNVGKLPAYSMVDMGFTYSPSSGSWNVSLYGKNLLDEALLGAVIPIPSVFYPGPDGQYLAGMGKGRRWGLEFSYFFE